jgi:hypothetical protein
MWRLKTLIYLEHFENVLLFISGQWKCKDDRNHGEKTTSSASQILTVRYIKLWNRMSKSKMDDCCLKSGRLRQNPMEYTTGSVLMLVKRGTRWDNSGIFTFSSSGGWVRKLERLTDCSFQGGKEPCQAGVGWFSQKGGSELSFNTYCHLQRWGLFRCPSQVGKGGSHLANLDQNAAAKWGEGSFWI